MSYCTLEFLFFDIHGCYSQVKIAFAPSCACKSNRRIWRHSASTSRSPDVTDQLWWRHNAKDRPWRQCRDGQSMIVFSRFVCSIHKIVCKVIEWYRLVWITVSCQSWCNTAMIFTSDSVTREYHCRIASLVTIKKSLFTRIHTLFYIWTPFV